MPSHSQNCAKKVFPIQTVATSGRTLSRSRGNHGTSAHDSRRIRQAESACLSDDSKDVSLSSVQQVLLWSIVVSTLSLSLPSLERQSAFPFLPGMPSGLSFTLNPALALLPLSLAALVFCFSQRLSNQQNHRTLCPIDFVFCSPPQTCAEPREAFVPGAARIIVPSSCSQIPFARLQSCPCPSA